MSETEQRIVQEPVAAPAAPIQPQPTYQVVYRLDAGQMPVPYQQPIMVAPQGIQVVQAYQQPHPTYAYVQQQVQPQWIYQQPPPVIMAQQPVQNQLHATFPQQDGNGMKVPMFKSQGFALALKIINPILAICTLSGVFSFALIYPFDSPCIVTCGGFYPYCFTKCFNDVGPSLGAFVGAAVHTALTFYMTMKGPQYSSQAQQRFHLALYIIDTILMIMTLGVTIYTTTEWLYATSLAMAVYSCVSASLALGFLTCDLANRYWEWHLPHHMPFDSSANEVEPRSNLGPVYQTCAIGTSPVAMKITHTLLALAILLSYSMNQLIGTFQPWATVQVSYISYDFDLSWGMTFALPLATMHLIFLVIAIPEDREYKAAWQSQLALSCYILNLCFLTILATMGWIFLFVPFVVPNSLTLIAGILWLIDFCMHRFPGLCRPGSYRGYETLQNHHHQQQPVPFYGATNPPPAYSQIIQPSGQQNNEPPKY